MEHFILNKKVVTLEKNKTAALLIPVLFNATSAEFVIEVSDEYFMEEICLELNAFRSTEKESLKKIQVELRSPIMRFRFSDFIDIEPKDYLLYSCKANRNVNLFLSIKGNSLVF